MARGERGTQIILGALNIVASPHPEGIYLRLLESSADIEIELYGNDWAKITKPLARAGHPDHFLGQILVWTHVDKSGRWIHKNKNKEATDEDKAGITIPDPLQPNFRPFSYGFILSKHRLVVEYKNEFGDRFGAKRAERFFARLFSKETLGHEFPEVSVTAIPEDDTIQKILSIPRLRRLEIHLRRPNPDDLSDDVARILAELEEQGAKSQDIILTKAPKIDSLTPNEETVKLAKVAAENGYVRGRGASNDGTVLDESTKEHPKSLVVSVSADQSANVRFRNAMERF
ncbi:DUF4747 family protein [Enterovirga sp.]|uniref:DUF4747 family protein n=1 Tax=Enterovirga sp. TaxID=2026350 RepID=UPI002B523E14|nr:DUF4747 family protein [Enterovirga sp.]HMO28592.1 DUF4747 family protein [Enterovirga sp.]